MNIKAINKKVELLSKTTKFLLGEAKKSNPKYSKEFDELSSRFTKDSKFRLDAFQKQYEDLKKAENAADLEKTVYGYLAMLQAIEENIITKYNAEKTFDKVFYTRFFRQFLKIKYLLLQGVKLEAKDPKYDDEYGITDGRGARFPTTAAQRGKRDPSVDAKGNKIPGINREESNENYLKAIKVARSRIGSDMVMSDPHEEELNAAIRTHADKPQVGIDNAETVSLELVSAISRDLSKLDPASSEVESAADDVNEMLTDDELSELEAAMKKIEAASREGLHIPHPDYDPADSNSPGYDEVEAADYVDMTMVNRLTDAERLAIRSLEIRKRGIANKKAKEAYRNRKPEEILRDQVKRQKDKKEKESRILTKIEQDNLTPTQIVRLLQQEYGDKFANETKKQTFNNIGMISLAMKSAKTKDEKSAVKSAVATIRQRLQKDFAKTKFLQHDQYELADLTEFFIEVYMKVLDAIFSHTEKEFKKDLGDGKIEIFPGEDTDDALALADIKDLKEKATPEAITAYYRYAELSEDLSADLAEMDEMDAEDRIDLNNKIRSLNLAKKQAQDISGMIEGFTGLRHLATSSTYDYYATEVWANAERDLAAAISVYSDANNLPKKVMTSKSISDKIIYYSMGRTYFGEIEGHPMAERTTEQIEKFAYDLIGHRLGSKRGASIPKVAGKTADFKDFNLSLEQSIALAEDCISSGGTIGKVIHRIFAPEYDEVSLLEEVKKFYNSKGTSYLFSKIYEGMLYGAFYRANPIGIEIPEAFKGTWMEKAEAFYKLLNAESDPKNELEQELKKLLDN